MKTEGNTSKMKLKIKAVGGKSNIDVQEFSKRK